MLPVRERLYEVVLCSNRTDTALLIMLWVVGMCRETAVVIFWDGPCGPGQEGSTGS